MTLFTQEFEALKYDCPIVLQHRLEHCQEPPLCQAQNCKCARNLLSVRTLDMYNQLYPEDEDPPLFCTLYRSQDTVNSLTIKDLTADLLKKRFRQWLRQVGLRDAAIWGVIDVCILTTTNALNKPLVSRIGFHWHFFMHQDDYTKAVRHAIRASLSQDTAAGKRPFMAKIVDQSKPFNTGYLYKHLDALNVKILTANRVLKTDYAWKATKAQRQTVAGFLNNPANIGPRLLYAQGLGQILKKNGF